MSDLQITAMFPVRDVIPSNPYPEYLSAHDIIELAIDIAKGADPFDTVYDHVLDQLPELGDLEDLYYDPRTRTNSPDFDRRMNDIVEEILGLVAVVAERLNMCGDGWWSLRDNVDIDDVSAGQVVLLIRRPYRLDPPPRVEPRRSGKSYSVDEVADIFSRVPGVSVRKTRTPGRFA